MEHNHVKLFFREFGDAGLPDLVIVHGLFGMSDNWVSHARALSHFRHVIAVDLRNHGLSPHTDEFDYELMASDILHTLSNQGIAEAEFIGHSMGGKVVMNLAFNYPDVVKKIIVADMAMKQGQLRDIHKIILDTISSIDLSKFSSFSEIQAELSKTITQEKILLFAMKNVIRRETGGFKWKLNYPSLYNNMGNIMEEVVPVGIFCKPSLFIRGGNSDYVLDQDFLEIKASFPNAKLETIDGASHWVHADNPHVFINLCKNFLGIQG